MPFTNTVATNFGTVSLNDFRSKTPSPLQEICTAAVLCICGKEKQQNESSNKFAASHSKSQMTRFLFFFPLFYRFIFHWTIIYFLSYLLLGTHHSFIYLLSCCCCSFFIPPPTMSLFIYLFHFFLSRHNCVNCKNGVQNSNRFLDLPPGRNRRAKQQQQQLQCR